MEKKKLNDSTQKKLYFKIGFILLLILLLTIPNALIQSLIGERQRMELGVQEEIALSWGPEQTLMGPVLTIPFEIIDEDDDSKVVNYLRILPDECTIDVEVKTEKRKKSIYSTVLYNAQHDIVSKFNIPTEEAFGRGKINVLWEESIIDIGITSARSLDNKANMTWNGSKYDFKSGASDARLFSSAIHAYVSINPDTKEYTMKSTIGINGSKGLKYQPLAGNTVINMTSPWDSPGFVGLPLPQKRTISDEGFTAQWNSTEYNRPFKNIWFNNTVNIQNHQYSASFGVGLVQTVGHYQKNMRCAKYALLIISLSFLVFFFFEMLKSNKIHPVQYIFVGLTLSVFYLLLLSFSEHIGFNLAYFAASSAVVGLITWYSRYILYNGGNVWVLSGILMALYGYIFTLLQMEDYALIVGSIGLFAALGITMYLSRNMNWYDLSGGPKIPEPDFTDASTSKEIV